MNILSASNHEYELRRKLKELNNQLDCKTRCPKPIYRVRKSLMPSTLQQSLYDSTHRTTRANLRVPLWRRDELLIFDSFGMHPYSGRYGERYCQQSRKTYNPTARCSLRRRRIWTAIRSLLGVSLIIEMCQSKLEMTLTVRPEDIYGMNSVWGPVRLNPLRASQKARHKLQVQAFRRWSRQYCWDWSAGWHKAHSARVGQSQGTDPAETNSWVSWVCETCNIEYILKVEAGLGIERGYDSAGNYFRG